MATQKKGSERGKHRHPRSLANLTHEGRPQQYETLKERHNISVTEAGWEGFKQLASEVEMKASELVEVLGRKEIDLSITLRDLFDESLWAKRGITLEQLKTMSLIEALKLLSVKSSQD